MKKIRDKLWTLLALLCVMLALYMFYGIYNQHQSGEIFFPFGYRPVVIMSGSMEPYLKTNSIVLVKETKDIEVQDVIFFITDDGTPVIHRCIGFEHGEMITKGDANNHRDFDTVSKHQLKGKVVLKLNL